MKTPARCLVVLGLAPAWTAAATLPVSQANHDDWIYNVPAGLLVCVDGALLFQSGTSSYALNRAAFERGYQPALALVDETVFLQHQFPQYVVRWKQQWESGDAATRRRYGPALVDATTPPSLRLAGARLCG